MILDLRQKKGISLIYSPSNSLRQHVYVLLKNCIMSGKIAPGDQIVESECAKTFNVSRTPVREAIGQLKDEGLVEYIPHVGTFVKIPTMEDIKEVYGAYIALSDLLVKHAMNRVQDHEIEKNLSNCG